MLRQILTEYNLASGPFCVSFSKQILNKFCQYILDKSDDQNLLHKTDAISEKIGEVCLKVMFLWFLINF